MSNQASSGSQDGPVSYDKDVLTKGQKNKYPKDHISIHCVQRAGRGLLMHSFNMLKDSQKMSDINFYTDVTLVDGLTLQGGEWPSVPWYPDTRNWSHHMRSVLPHQNSLCTLSKSLCHPGLSISKQNASHSPHQASKNE